MRGVFALTVYAVSCPHFGYGAKNWPLSCKGKCDLGFQEVVKYSLRAGTPWRIVSSLRNSVVGIVYAGLSWVWFTPMRSETLWTVRRPVSGQNQFSWKRSHPKPTACALHQDWILPNGRSFTNGYLSCLFIVELNRRIEQLLIAWNQSNQTFICGMLCLGHDLLHLIKLSEKWKRTLKIRALVGKAHI